MYVCHLRTIIINTSTIKNAIQTFIANFSGLAKNNLITCAEFIDFCFFVYIAVMLFCCSLFCKFLLCTCLLYFYFCAASYGVIKNECVTQSYKRLLLCLNSSRNNDRPPTVYPATKTAISRRRLDILFAKCSTFL